MTVPKINSAHGSDTRNIINRAIEVLNQQGISIQDLVAEGQLTEEQYAELITVINGLIKSGHVDKSDLTSEFKDEIEDFSAQLAQTQEQKISKGEASVFDIDKNKGKLDQTYMTDEFLQQIAGETSINAVPADDSITLKKTTIYKIGKNLFNKADVLSGHTVGSQGGTIVPLEGTNASDFITVEPNTTYTRSHGWTLAFYDADKLFISGIGSGYAGEYTFTTPANAKYVRVSVKDEYLNVTQIEEGSLSTPYEKYREFIDFKYIEDIPAKTVTPDTTTFFKYGKNLFDKKTILINKTVNSTDGAIWTFDVNFASDFIPVEPSTTYTRSHGWTLAFYDINKDYISGVGSSLAGKYTFTTPGNTRYIRVSSKLDELDILQIEKGTETTNYEPYGLYLDKKVLPEASGTKSEPKFRAEFTTTRLPREINDTNNRNLSLISKKTVQEGDGTPDTVGYLYLDQSTQRIYYSSGVFDNPTFLFDWDWALGNNMGCQYFNAFITNEGDVIFFRNRQRSNPIIYPASDYNQPFVVEFGDKTKPYSFETDTGIDIHPSGEYFVFGEYTSHKLEDEENNDPRNIWKVTEPFSDPNNWVVKHSFKHVYYTSPVSDEPDNEIGHIHTVIRDFYNGVWYCSTGDIDRHCRVWQSVDEGETWEEVAVNGQRWRAFGMIFTKDSAYWGTDAHGVNVHALYKVDRDSNSGILDFSTLELLSNLDLTSGQPQPTYTTCYLREPHGLLFLDRAETRSDHLLDLLFWSFEYERLFKLGTYRDLHMGSPTASRNGWGNQVATHYQPTSENGIICGSNSTIRINEMDVLNNHKDNRVGNLKIRVYEA